ncbi:50S ribosomal protein L16 [Candidatus Geothermarchaeota archaeon]|nr:MAG: 50S ribosomal protein L16 [Candidatus Geothermarchaeota archaeon]HEW93899.1 50S ribosomal protein L16 [Thermoprotei archaeon]
MKAKNLRSIKGQLYTRLEYIHGAPQSRITRFNMGTLKDDYNVVLTLRAKERVLVRDRALEALRVNVNRLLQKKVGSQNYYFTILVYPHHVLRENKMMTGAGADRLQEGMRRAFGKPIGRAAPVWENQAIAKVYTYPQFLDNAYYALKAGASKIPKGAKIEIEYIR